jgi:hypothetical protein
MSTKVLSPGIHKHDRYDDFESFYRVLVFLSVFHTELNQLDEREEKILAEELGQLLYVADPRTLYRYRVSPDSTDFNTVALRKVKVLGPLLEAYQFLVDLRYRTFDPPPTEEDFTAQANMSQQKIEKTFEKAKSGVEFAVETIAMKWHTLLTKANKDTLSFPTPIFLTTLVKILPLPSWIRKFGTLTISDHEVDVCASATDENHRWIFNQTLALMKEVLSVHGDQLAQVGCQGENFKLWNLAHLLHANLETLARSNKVIVASRSSEKRKFLFAELGTSTFKSFDAKEQRTK